MAITAQTRSGARRLHLDFLDGVRGVAALYVLLHHVWQFSITDPQSPAPRWFSALTVFKYGSFAVAVFIVVSGFCLMLPVLRNGGMGNPGGLPVFAKRRAHRILPPYFAVLAASMLLIALYPALRRLTGTPWDITLPSFTTGKVTSHLFLFHNWFEQWHYGFNPPLWSIALEFQIYFVFALVLLPVWRRWGTVAVVAAAFAIAVVPWALGAGFAAPWMLGMFGLGMAAARIAMAPDTVSWARRLPWRALTLAAVCAVPVVTAVSSRFGSHELELFACHLSVGVATALGLVTMSFGRLPGQRPGVVDRGLSSRPLRRLGAFSYSLYLVHYPIVAVLTIAVIRPRGWDVPESFVGIAVLAIPASLLAGALFWRLVERRFLNPPLTTEPSAAGVA